MCLNCSKKLIQRLNLEPKAQLTAIFGHIDIILTLKGHQKSTSMSSYEVYIFGANIKNSLTKFSGVFLRTQEGEQCDKNHQQHEENEN